MIEDKELGLKIAENKDEAFWTKFKTDAIKEIDMANKTIEINNHLIVLAEKKIQESLKPEEK